MSLCPCKSGKNYAVCCEPFMMHTAIAETPEQLMRSRYTAYTQANMDYIAATMKDVALNDFDAAAAKQWAESVTWVKLKVLRTGLDSAESGFVEFKAYYRYKKQMHVMHECSRFQRHDQQWFYSGST